LKDGTYFGEIGLLLTGKRTCSIRAKTSLILLKIKKEPFLEVLEKFPTQLEYLKSVAR
jgi:CRP-like cAMP-binding protein